MTGQIIKGVGGLYAVKDGTKIYQCRARGIFRKTNEKPLVGDHVDYEITSEEDSEGSITAIHERKNRLIRPEAANVDLILVVFSVKDPDPNYDMLNRYLCMMKDAEIPTMLTVTKTDLADEAKKKEIRDIFINTEIPLVFLSSKSGEGIEELRGFIKGKTVIMAGPSGVGKSSLLNLLTGQEIMATGELSRKIRRGKNTTRHTEIFSLDDDTLILDSPGFTSVDISFIEPENLVLYFPEFMPYIGGCNFSSCRHLKEPGCRIKQAVEEGDISRTRYQSYCTFLTELINQRRY